MPGRRMLRDMMSVNDIYSFADPIMEMLREEYGSYDADTLDEVQVDEEFAQRLQARGYEVRTGNEQPAPVPTPAPAPIPTSIATDTPVVPVTVVRARRPAAGTTGGPASGPTRTRRTTTPGDGTRPATRVDTSRAGGENTRPAASSARPASDSGSAAASSAEAAAPGDEAERPTRTRRTTRTRSTGDDNGEAMS